MNTSKQGFVGDIEEITQNNDTFRTVLYTAQHSQLVVMCLKPGEDIGMEIHGTVDQFLRIESGNGKTILNGEESDIKDGSAIIVKAGVEHNVVNKGSTDLKLYTVYSPANHPEGTIHQTRDDAMEAEKHEHDD